LGDFRLNIILEKAVADVMITYFCGVLEFLTCPYGIQINLRFENTLFTINVTGTEVFRKTHYKALRVILDFSPSVSI
jgi:hypothetical protein